MNLVGSVHDLGNLERRRTVYRVQCSVYSVQTMEAFCVTKQCKHMQHAGCCRSPPAQRSPETSCCCLRPSAPPPAPESCCKLNPTRPVNST